jgi:hypothetical protein
LDQIPDQGQKIASKLAPTKPLKSITYFMFDKSELARDLLTLIWYLIQEPPLPSPLPKEREPIAGCCRLSVACLLRGVEDGAAHAGFISQTGLLKIICKNLY